MDDVIKLLPDAVANQIAAGEVIQRPASVVKELMENAIDAGATNIKLIVKDAGRTLIQVVDNGNGMSETDARLCFERHATSKINEARDLFSIRSMGFRGEALASIAAIARVELKTRTTDNQIGTEVIIEGSVTEGQQPCQCPSGTSIAVKNLFFNTPARRKFLKSDQVEKGHIFSEFVRIALSFPDVSFDFYQNNLLTHKLEKGNLKQRIVNLFGNQYQQKLVPVDEQTDIIGIHGYVLKPEFAKKRKSEQFLFVNNRFIRSPYLNHAIEQAFQDLIPEDMYPCFFLFLETDPDQIDVNVHPTKTEIKFQDERYVYQIIKSSVKRALGKFNITPTLDFERETAFDDLTMDKQKAVTPPEIKINQDYNPFREGQTGSSPHSSLAGKINPEKWDTFFPGNDDLPKQKTFTRESLLHADSDTHEVTESSKKFLHLHNKFILVAVKSGLMVVDQHLAHERILFERYIEMFEKQTTRSQQLLFPETIILMDHDAGILIEIMPHIKAMGFEISEAKKGTFIIHAVPADFIDQGLLQDIIEDILEQYKKFKTEPKSTVPINLIRSMAKRMAVKHGKQMNHEEMTLMIENLFACDLPYQSPTGKPTVIIIGLDEFTERFK